MKNSLIYNNLFWVIMFMMPIHLVFWDPITKNIMMICVGILFLLSFQKISQGLYLHKLIKHWGRAMLYIVFTALAFMAFSCPYNLEDISLVAIPLALTFGSYCLFTQDDETMEKYIFVFCIVSAVCAVIILINSGGFTIVDIYRKEVHKNAVAPFYCQVGVLALSAMLNSMNKYKKIVYIAAFSMCFILSVVLRARTAMFALIIASFILLLNKYRSKTFIYLSAISLVSFTFWGEQIMDILYASVVGGNKDLYDVDSITSGRTERNEIAIRYISQNLFWGASANHSLSNYIFSEWYLIPHNYVIYTLVKYGFVGSVGYLYIYWQLVKQAYLNYKSTNLLCLGCLLIALVVSLAEYCSPFGPGTTYVITYLILGRTLRNAKYNFNK